MLICANINLFGFFKPDFMSLKLCVKEVGLPEIPLSSTSEQDILLF